MWNLLQRHRRRRLLAQPYPRGWDAILVRNLAHFALLSEGERLRLRDDLRVFVAEKRWEGCGGLAITEEMKVTIAAQACLMLLGLEHDYFARVGTILVYPGVVRLPELEEGGLEQGVVIAGQAVQSGPVILAWDNVLAQGRDPTSGNNLVIHEFAHALDFLDGYLEGTLGLVGEPARRWSEVLDAEYNELRREVRAGRDTFLGAYGATNKTEFFAVASERFFTRPVELRQYHPFLFEGMVKGYQVDPTRWFGGGDGRGPS
jgi:Mlc titration factor MtfA (ptsG expression regulator)